MAASEPAASTNGDMRLGLALSGGGFRASLFHVGVLARLAELDLLRRVEVLSCVSGGSIIGALYYLYLKRELEARDDDLERHDYVRLVHEMEAHFLAAVQGNFRWLTFASLGHNCRMARADYSRTDRFGDLLDERLYRPIWNGDRNAPIEMRRLEIHPGIDRAEREADRERALSFHPNHHNAGRRNKVPILVINATTLNSGHAWWFQASRMGEPDLPGVAERVDKNLRLRSERYDRIANPIQATMPLGQAVAASAAVPGILPPFPISDLYESPDGSRRLRVQLVDGGVHDNLGIAALDCNECTHFVVSDATGQMGDLAEPDTWPGAVIGRSSSILMDRVRETELDLLLRGRRGRVALMHLRRDLHALEGRLLNGHTPDPESSEPEVPTDQEADARTDHGVDREAQKLLARMRTDLDAFSDVEAFALMADGYGMTAKEFEGLPADVWRLEESAAPDSGWRFAALFEPLAEAPAGLLWHLGASRYRLFKLVRLKRAYRRVAKAVAGTIALGLIAMLVWWYASMAGDTSWRFGPDRRAEVMFWLLVVLLSYPAYLVARQLTRASRTLRPLGRIVDLAGSTGTLAAAPLLWLVARIHLHLFNDGFLAAGRLDEFGWSAQPRAATADAAERRPQQQEANARTDDALQPEPLHFALHEDQAGPDRWRDFPDSGGEKARHG